MMTTTLIKADVATRLRVDLCIEGGKIVAEPASSLTDEQKQAIRQNREAILLELEKDEVLRKAMTYLSENGVPYVPLDVEEDINKSYEEDDLEAFRKTLRGWVKELMRRAA